MSQLDNFIQELLSIEGATGAAVVDISSGMALPPAVTPASTSTLPRPVVTPTWSAPSCGPRRTSTFAVRSRTS